MTDCPTVSVSRAQDENHDRRSSADGAERWATRGHDVTGQLDSWCSILAITHLSFDVTVSERTPGKFNGGVVRRAIDDIMLVDCMAAPFEDAVTPPGSGHPVRSIVRMCSDSSSCTRASRWFARAAESSRSRLDRSQSGTAPHRPRSRSSSRSTSAPCSSPASACCPSAPVLENSAACPLWTPAAVGAAARCGT